MNRHLLPDDMPSEALGTPIRSEKSGPQDGEWQPHNIPGYEVRVMADGRREIRPTAGSLTEMAGRPLPTKKATAWADIEDRVWNDDGLRKRLLERRGGCRCCISPPCHSCTEPITEAEAEMLGLLED